MMVEFEEALATANAIQGWLGENEAALLWKVAGSVSSDRMIVEVGTYRGKSATLLAHTGLEIACIDPLIPDWGDGNNMQITDYEASKLARTIAPYSNVRWWRLRSIETPLSVLRKAVGLLYIDGDHLAPAPLADFLHFRPAMETGSFVAFHDRGLDGVSAAINELEETKQIRSVETAGGMYLGRIL